MTSFFALICLLLSIQLVYPFVTVLVAQLFGRRNNNKAPSYASTYVKTLADKKATAGKPVHQSTNPPVYQTTNPHYACIITAYRNAEIAKPLVQSLLGQTYPNFTIYFVADECPDFDFGITDPRFVALRPSEPLRLKAKSILKAIENFRHAHDFVAIFDADNLAHPKYLEELNPFISVGFRCIQGQRTAKNLDSTYAALDSMGEHYKNYIEREVPYRLGGSAVISGSGMATETELYQAYLASPEIEQGQHQWKKMLQEDKILQNFLLLAAERIAYARQAVVYDEKVETGSAVETQRSRWLFSYFQNVPNALGILRRGFLGLNFNQLYFGFVTLALPMFIQLALAIILALLALFILPIWSGVLLVAIVIFGLNILWVLYLDEAPPEVWRAVWQVPKFVLRQLTGLFKMRDPNKHFKHTEHRKMVSVDEIVGRTSDSAQKD